MDRTEVTALLARLHEAQGTLYAGGPAEPIRALLADAVCWHVPGVKAIAGVYVGVEAVLGYFLRRRDLTSDTFKMHPGDVLVGDGRRVAVLTEGSAIIRGREHRWSTVGLYEFANDRVAA